MLLCSGGTQTGGREKMINGVITVNTEELHCTRQGARTEQSRLDLRM